jgi:hypothetical protein
MKIIAPTMLALLLAIPTPAWATGTVRIQQNNDSVQTYTGVLLKIVGKTLTLTSSDGVSTVVISGADCGDINTAELVRCTGGKMSLQQDGATNNIPFKHATFYFNLTDQELALPLSTMKVSPHSVIFAAQTDKGTFITGDGRLDKEPAK